MADPGDTTTAGGANANGSSSGEKSDMEILVALALETASETLQQANADSGAERDADADADAESDSDRSVHRGADNGHVSSSVNVDDSDSSRVPRSSSLVGKLIDWYVRKLCHGNGKWWMIILALDVFLLWPFGFVAFKELPQHTDSTFRSTSHSPSAAAAAAYENVYKNVGHGNNFDNSLQPPIFAVLYCGDGANASVSVPCDLRKNGLAEEFATGMKDWLLQKVPPPPVPQENTNDTNVTSEWIEVLSYYYYHNNRRLRMMGKPFMSSNGNATMLEIQYSIPEEDSKTNYTINDHISPRDRVYLIVDALDSYRDEFFLQNNASQQISVGYTGLTYFSKDLRESTRHDLHRMDSLVAPCALILVGLVVGLGRTAGNISGRNKNRRLLRSLGLVWIVPLMGMLSTVSVWSLLLLQISCHTDIQITQFTPSVMMSLTLGMGMDYTLFLLARFVECATDPNRKVGAIIETMHSAGQVVIWSGTTLLCTFLGLVWLPLSMMQSIGIGAALAIASSMFMNLAVVVPTLLASPFGSWMIGHDIDEEADGVLNGGDDRVTNNGNVYHLLDAPQTSDEESALENGTEHDDSMIVMPTPKNSIWVWLSRQLLHPYKSIICLLLVIQFIIIPVSQHALGMRASSIAFELLLPSSAPSLQMYRILESSLGGPGTVAPFRILIDGSRTNTSVIGPGAFDSMHRIVAALRGRDDDSLHVKMGASVDVKDGRLDGASFLGGEREYAGNRSIVIDKPLDDSHILEADKVLGRLAHFSGISVLDNIPIPFAAYAAAKACAGRCHIESANVLNELDKHITAPSHYATYLIVTLDVSPFSHAGTQWMDRTRRILSDMHAQAQNRSREGVKDDILADLDLYLDGTAAVAHDAVTSVYQSFPTVIGITFAVVFALMGLFFRSFIPPLRSIVSIVCTLGFSFGLASWKFEDGFAIGSAARVASAALDGGDGKEICWVVPIMSFSIIVGLALDYDVFLISRIAEYRFDSGYAHHTSIVAGLHATGGIITAAGVLLALSFGSLLWSDSPALYQWSFLMTTAVLLDTFVVRTIIVPALTGMFRWDVAWWPRSAERGRIRYDKFD